MKAAAESRTKLYVAIALMAVAVFSIVWAFTKTSPPAPVAATSPATSSAQPAPATTSRRNSANAPITSNIDPTLRLDLLKSSEDIEYLGKGRNIFRAQAEPAPEIPKITQTPLKQPDPGPPPPPPPPPITLKFFGFASRSGESKKIFLSQNDDIFVATEGDIVKGRYKILHINPNSIEVEDVLNNNRQSIPLTQS